MRVLRYIGAASLLGVLFTGCDDLGLEVDNPNNPNRDNVLGTAAEVRNLAASQYQQITSATVGSISGVNQSLVTISFENASGLNNNGMGPRSEIPRGSINNAPGNQFSSENFRDFRMLQSVSRTAADILERIKDPDFELAQGGQEAVDQLIAWTHFFYGVSLGYVSLVYDKAAIPQPGDDPEADPAELVDYSEVHAYAMDQLDSAVAYASGVNINLPGGWLTGAGGSSMAADDFVRVIRSFRARMRAGVARTAAERDNVDWDAVIADATNGIESDFEVEMDPNAGWNHSWLGTSLHFRDVNWHQMTPYILGMGDVSGGFEDWLRTPRSQRSEFLIRSPDLRLPQGSTRDDQVANPGHYFRTRAEGDDPSPSWRSSYNDHYRFRGFSEAGNIGPHPVFTLAENDMLAAEGYIRKGDYEEAAKLIDKTRTDNGLPALSGQINSLDDPVPGGSQCVPRVPDPDQDYTRTKCGNILEAMKWEKRLEMAYTTYGGWFFDSRGWNDLPYRSPLHWPVAYQELNARREAVYNTGGSDPESSAPETTTYGYGVGDR